VAADLSPQLIYGMKAALPPLDKNLPEVKAAQKKRAETNEILQRIKLTVQGEFSLENQTATITLPATVIAATNPAPVVQENHVVDANKTVKP